MNDAEVRQAVAGDLLFVGARVEQIGTITNFDEASGLGIVTDAGGRPLDFHCTQIADGSRTIAVGTAVVFGIMYANLGGIEATEIRPRS